MRTDDSILACRDLAFSYHNGKKLFLDVNLAFSAGSFIILKGPSGSGKSTFLRLLIRLEQPCSGTITFHGHPIGSYEPARLRRSVGYLHQTPSLWAGTVRENLLLPLHFKANRDISPPTDEDLSDRLAQVHLEPEILQQHAMSLSIGQQQRLCLLRALLLGPEILLLDEPTSALDQDSKIAVEELIVDLCRQELMTVFFVSHQPLGIHPQRAIKLNILNQKIVRES